MLKAIIVILLSVIICQFTDASVYHLFNVASVNPVGPYSSYLPEVLLIFLAVISLLILFVVMLKVQHRYRWPLAIIIGAGSSNLLDRLFYGGVVDYIKFFNISIVNLADIAITASVIILILLMLRDRSRVISKSRNEDKPH